MCVTTNNINHSCQDTIWALARARLQWPHGWRTLTPPSDIDNASIPANDFHERCVRTTLGDLPNVNKGLGTADPKICSGARISMIIHISNSVVM